jgi:hypothetical protein
MNLTDNADHDAAHPSPGPKCFRISGIPNNWNESNLLIALYGIDPSLQDQKYQLSLHPACCGRTQTALLNVDSFSEYFQRILRLENDSKFEKIQDTVNRTDVILILDCNFLGLTPLNTPEGEIAAE